MNRIKEILEEKGIKQTWLAERLGKSYNMVNGYVQNRQQPRLEVLFEIAKIQYEETNGDIDKLNQNIKFIDTANKKGFESDFSSLKEKHFYALASSHFKKATDKEKSNKYPDAIQVYKKAIECSEKSSNNSVKHNSIARIEICNLKQMSLEYN